MAYGQRVHVINGVALTGKPLARLINVGRFVKIEPKRFANQSLSRISRVS